MAAVVDVNMRHALPQQRHQALADDLGFDLRPRLVLPEKDPGGAPSVVWPMWSRSASTISSTCRAAVVISPCILMTKLRPVLGPAMRRAPGGTSARVVAKPCTALRIFSLSTVEWVLARRPLPRASDLRAP